MGNRSFRDFDMDKILFLDIKDSFFPQMVSYMHSDLRYWHFLATLILLLLAKLKAQ